MVDLDVEDLALADGDTWTGGTAGGVTWTVTGPPAGGATVAGHVGGHATLELRTTPEGAPALLVTEWGAQPAFTIHLVAQLVAPPASPAPGLATSLVALLTTPDGQWRVGDQSSGPVGPGLHVLTVAADGTHRSFYVDGTLIDSVETDAGLPADGALLAAGGPGHVWRFARLVITDSVSPTLTADMDALVAEYVPGATAISATGSWGFTGTAAVTVNQLYMPPSTPAAHKGGKQVRPPIPEPVDPPASLDKVRVRRHSETMPTPTLGAHGFPVDWEPTSVVKGNWGELQVVVEGVDVTYWDDVPIPFPTWERGEPFGAVQATLQFPQITTFHTVPDWCMSGSSVEIIFRGSSGDLQAFTGVIDKFQHAEDDGVFTVSARGPIYVTDLQLRQPGWSPAPQDIGTVIADVLNSAVSRRTTKVSPVVTGCRTSVLGGWEPRVTGYLQQLLSTAVKNGRQWTVKCIDRTPVIELKDTDTVTWTVTNGQRGIGVDLSQDWSQAPNVIYGEGISPAGGRWRNAVYPGWRPDDTPEYPGSLTHGFTVGTTDASTSTGTGVSDWQERADQPVTGRFSQDDRARTFEIQKAAGITQDGLVGPQTWAATFGTGSNTGTLDAFFMPLAWAKEVMPRKYGPDGTDLGANPAYDGDVLRVEDKIDFGQGVRRAEAKTAARELLGRWMDPGWSGTVTFELDPEERSKYSIREGSNGIVKGHHGQDLKVHVAYATYDESTVVATVDTNARDFPMLDAIRERERNATDPAKALVKRLQQGSVTEARATFDAESPAGYLPRHALFGNLWSVVPVPFGVYGNVVRTRITTSGPGAPFAVAVFNQPITAAELLSLVGNPLTAEDNPWDEKADDLAEAGLIMAWGWKSQPCGYYPRQYTTADGDKSAPITGRMLDDTSWDYATEHAPRMWVASIASTGCWIEGRFSPGVD